MRLQVVWSGFMQFKTSLLELINIFSLKRMKRFMFRLIISICLFYITGFFVSCSNSSNKKGIETPAQKETQNNNNKPPSSFSDTLIIDTKAAIFYYPDSLQLEKIKAVTDSNVFNGSMHEYFYQFRYAHIVLKKYWRAVNIIEARNVRYLLFLKTDKSTEIVDLDTKMDAYGLFVFDRVKSPVLLELTNAESEIGFYFSK